MTKRITVLTTLASGLFIGACLSALFAREDSPASWKTLEKSYAQASLELAQARLAKAKSENATVGGAVSAGMMGQLEAGVQLTQDRLQLLDSNNSAALYAPQLIAVQDEVKGLEADHAKSLNANQFQAGAVSQFELRREQAEIDVAKARLAVLKSLGQQSPEVRMQWEICQLQDEIRALWARPLIED